MLNFEIEGDLKKQEIREKFENFVGKERYLKFLETIQHSNPESGRLKFKQEREWEKFVDKYRLEISDYKDIWRFFQYCYLHGMEFEEDTVKIIYGTRVPLSETKHRKIQENYPHANFVVYAPCWVEAAKTKQILYCKKCRENYYKKEPRHTRK